MIENIYKHLENPENKLGNTDIVFCDVESSLKVISNLVDLSMELSVIYSGGKKTKKLAVELCSESTPEQPAIIFETGASPCTMLLIWSQEGFATVTHVPYYERYLSELDHKSMQNTDNELERLKGVLQRLGENGKMLFTGTNISPDLQKRILKEVAEAFEVEPSSVTTKLDYDEPMREGVPLGLAKTATHSLIFIPSALSKDKRNKIVLLRDTQEDLNKESTVKNLLSIPQQLLGLSA